MSNHELIARMEHEASVDEQEGGFAYAILREASAALAAAEAREGRLRAWIRRISFLTEAGIDDIAATPQETSE